MAWLTNAWLAEVKVLVRPGKRWDIPRDIPFGMVWVRRSLIPYLSKDMGSGFKWDIPRYGILVGLFYGMGYLWDIPVADILVFTIYKSIILFATGISH